VSDKIRQAIDEVDIETSNPELYFIEPDLKEKLANKIATFLAKGVGNPSVIYDILKKCHDEGKYPANTPQGRGENLRNYTDRILAMFTVQSGAMKLQTEGTKKMLVMSGNSGELSDKAKAQAYETPEPNIPKSAERRTEAS
jgi:hypothetical protein